MSYNTKESSQASTILVGRAPWPAADPLVGLLARTKSRTRGSGADEGVRPTLGCCSAVLWGRMVSCAPVVNLRLSAVHTIRQADY